MRTGLASMGGQCAIAHSHAGVLRFRPTYSSAFSYASGPHIRPHLVPLPSSSFCRQRARQPLTQMPWGGGETRRHAWYPMTQMLVTALNATGPYSGLLIVASGSSSSSRSTTHTPSTIPTARVPGSGFRVLGSGFRVPGSGFRAQGSFTLGVFGS